MSEQRCQECGQVAAADSLLELARLALAAANARIAEVERGKLIAERALELLSRRLKPVNCDANGCPAHAKCEALSGYRPCSDMLREHYLALAESEIAEGETGGTE